MGTRQEFTFIGVSITADPTQAITWATLQTTPGPDEGGTIPTTFSKVPAVDVATTMIGSPLVEPLKRILL